MIQTCDDFGLDAYLLHLELNSAIKEKGPNMWPDALQREHGGTNAQHQVPCSHAAR